MKMVLGSSSKRRSKILKDLGYEFEIISPDINEKGIRHEDPRILTMAIAEAKNRAVVDRLDLPAIVISSDQVVVCNGIIREKPIDESEARVFLNSYASFPAETVTSVVVSNTQNGFTVKDTDTARVYFNVIPDEVINELIRQGNIFNAAGGFIAEDPLLAPYILKIDGESESVMGLPKTMTKRLISEVSRFETG